MSVFRFKRFDVVNERSAMKVNTDGVLLGAAMTIKPEDRRLLDIGTGTGTIALMAAQRVLGIPGQAGNDGREVWNDVMVDAIDIDGPSAEEADANFRNSPWSGHMRAVNMSLDDFAEATVISTSLNIIKPAISSFSFTEHIGSFLLHPAIVIS